MEVMWHTTNDWRTSAGLLLAVTVVFKFTYLLIAIRLKTAVQCTAAAVTDSRQHLSRKKKQFTTCSSTNFFWQKSPMPNQRIWHWIFFYIRAIKLNVQYFICCNWHLSVICIALGRRGKRVGGNNLQHVAEKQNSGKIFGTLRHRKLVR